MEENKISEEIFDDSQNGIDESFSAKKRIIRRSIRPRKKLANILRSKEKIIEKKEINDVLTNLYAGEDQESMQEFVVKKNSSFFKTSVFLGLTVFFAAIIWAGFFILPSSGRDENQVSLSINGPTDLFLGGTSTYTISYANNSSVELKNVVLSAYYPEGFVFENGSPKPENAGNNEWKLGTLSPYQKGVVNLTGLAYGSLDEKKSWRIFLNYSPENFNSELQKATTLTTGISSSPIKLSISGPEQVAVGTDAKFNFELEKPNDWKKPIIIIPELPNDFVIVTSTPALDKKIQWQISESSKEEKIKYSITGKFTNVNNSSSEIRGAAVYPMNSNQNYRIANAKISSELVKNEVNISLAVNGSGADFDSRPGETLNATLRVKNSSSKEIKNITIKTIFSAPAIGKQSLLKWASIVDKFDGDLLGEQIDNNTRLGTITWTKKHIPSLETIKPNEEISIDVQLPIKNSKEFDLSLIKTPQITINSEAKFTDASKNNQSVSIKPLNITLNSDLSFENDDDISSSGSGETHKVSWILKNSFHALKNIQVTATVYGNPSFDILSRSAGELVFNQTKSTITWKINEMPEETDVLNASFSLLLNKKNPTQTLLLSKAHLTAEDTITGKTINLAVEEISPQ